MAFSIDQESGNFLDEKIVVYFIDLNLQLQIKLAYISNIIVKSFDSQLEEKKMKAKVAVMAIVASLTAGVGNANETVNAPVSMHNVKMLEENLSDSASGPNVEHWERGGGGRWERGGGGHWERGGGRWERGGGRWERGGGGHRGRERGGWERRHR